MVFLVLNAQSQPKDNAEKTVMARKENKDMMTL